MSRDPVLRNLFVGVHAVYIAVFYSANSGAYLGIYIYVFGFGVFQDDAQRAGKEPVSRLCLLTNLFLSIWKTLFYTNLN